MELIKANKETRQNLNNVAKSLRKINETSTEKHNEESKRSIDRGTEAFDQTATEADKLANLLEELCGLSLTWILEEI
jgi:uncharacterized phage infection (PIP) family protein YhgE